MSRQDRNGNQAGVTPPGGAAARLWWWVDCLMPSGQDVIVLGVLAAWFVILAASLVGLAMGLPRVVALPVGCVLGVLWPLFALPPMILLDVFVPMTARAWLGPLYAVLYGEHFDPFNPPPPWYRGDSGPDGGR